MSVNEEQDGTLRFGHRAEETNYDDDEGDDDDDDGEEEEVEPGTYAMIWLHSTV